MGARGDGTPLGAGPGELVAVDLPPGPMWPEVVADLWNAGAVVLPLDRRLRAVERRAILDVASPTMVLEETGFTVFADGGPADGRLGAVVATSGTGGAPRLVELSRASLVAAIEVSASQLGITASDPWVLCLTPAHVGGLLVLLRGVMLGATVIVHERFDAARLVEEAPEGACVSLVPAMLAGLVGHGAALSRFGALLVGGGSLDEGLAAAARDRGARVVTTYGLTEACGGVAYDGRMLAGTDVRLRGTDRQIELRGPTLMEGYRHDPGATAAAFTVDGWLRTGDAGHLDDEGLLRVDGRVDDLIRTGGEKVWPDEVERALGDHPKVGDVAVAGRPDPVWGQQVVAFVVPRAGDDPPSLEELRDRVSRRIARFKVPRRLVVVSEIPRTADGKLLRAALPR